MECFMMHPLFIRIVNNNICFCNSGLIDISLFTINKTYPAVSTITLNATTPEVLSDKLFQWLKRRRLIPRTAKIGITDTENQRIYVVDMAIENKDGDIMFMVWFPSTKRLSSIDINPMIEYAHQLQDITMRTFQFRPAIILVNVYGDCKLSTQWVHSE
jgi:hypothetical protein